MSSKRSTWGNAAELAGEYPFELLKILPYLAVLVAALVGAHVLIVLVGRTIFAGVIGLLDGSYHFSSFLQAIAEGIMPMEDLAIVSI